RMYCAKCSSQGPFESMKLGREGEVHVFTIIHQATPYVQAPYIAAIIDMPEGVSINSNIVGIEPKPENVKFGMKVKMFTEKVSEDKEGNSYIAYKFQPA
ncbi:MAG: OB-fold domain-containing protein, partial [Tepidiformaceae bacterium]